jgi:hypothetical protein
LVESLRLRNRLAVLEDASPPSRPARRQHDLHAGIDIEGLSHRLVHLIDRKFVGDEFLQRIGCLELVQETQAARVAGRGMVGHTEKADLVRQRIPAPIDGDVADIGEHACDKIGPAAP